MLKTTTLTIAAGLILATTSFAQAGSWERSATTYGPHGGQWTVDGRGSCSGGGCSSVRHRTGPYGGTVSRYGSTNCSGGACRGTATYVGPAGRTVTRERYFRRY